MPPLAAVLPEILAAAAAFAPEAAAGAGLAEAGIGAGALAGAEAVGAGAAGLGAAEAAGLGATGLGLAEAAGSGLSESALASLGAGGADAFASAPALGPGVVEGAGAGALPAAVEATPAIGAAPFGGGSPVGALGFAPPAAEGAGAGSIGDFWASINPALSEGGAAPLGSWSGSTAPLEAGSGLTSGITPGNVGAVGLTPPNTLAAAPAAPDFSGTFAQFAPSGTVQGATESIEVVSPEMFNRLDAAAAMQPTPVATTTIPGPAPGMEIPMSGQPPVPPAGTPVSGAVPGAEAVGGAAAPASAAPSTTALTQAAGTAAGAAPAGTEATAAGGGAKAAEGGGVGSWLAKNPGLLASLGLGGAALAMQAGNRGNIPQQPNLEALAANQKAFGERQEALQQHLVAPLVTDTLPPAQQASVDRALNDAIATTKARYAQMGLGNSSALEEQISYLKQNAQVIKGQLEQQMATTGMQAASTAASAFGLQNSVFQSLMQAQIQQDTALRNAIAQFAGSAAIGSGLASRA